MKQFYITLVEEGVLEIKKDNEIFVKIPVFDVSYNQEENQFSMYTLHITTEFVKLMNGNDDNSIPLNSKKWLDESLSQTFALTMEGIIDIETHTTNKAEVTSQEGMTMQVEFAYNDSAFVECKIKLKSESHFVLKPLK